MKYGYSDGKDAGGEKWVGKWVTYGKNLAMGKPYTLSVPPAEKRGKRATRNEEADRRPRRLELLRRQQLQGRAALEQGHEARRSPSISASRRRPPRSASTSTAIPAQDAIKGKVKDEVEVFTSADGKEFTPAGKFDFNLRWKDIPVNYMWSGRRERSSRTTTRSRSTSPSTRAS